MLKRLLRGMLPAGLRGWPPPDAPLVSLDVETTGLDPATAQILSIGAVPIVGRRVIVSERFELLLRREQPTHEDTVRIHRLRAMDLADGVAPEEALRRFRDWLGERPILGYCVDFDRGVLNRALQAAGVGKLDVAAYDLRELYRRRQSGEVQDRAQLPGLDGILAATGVPPLARHTAIGDAVATALAYLALRHRQQPLTPVRR